MQYLDSNYGLLKPEGFLCERHLGHVPWSLRFELYLFTAVDSRPGPGGSRTTASCQPKALRPWTIPLRYSVGCLLKPEGLARE